MCDKLKEYREQIDQIDDQLYTLYKKRLGISRAVGIYKHKHKHQILDSKREEAIKEQLRKKYNDDANFLAYMYLHEAMMRVSRNAQYIYHDTIPKYTSSFAADAQIGYQGTLGSFSLMAVNKVFKHAKKHAFETFESVFQAVQNGEVTYGVIPLENSIHGEVIQIFDLLQTYNDIYIIGEVLQPIEHCLLGVQSATIADIREVYSHPQALAQSSAYLKKHKQIQLKASENTALSAKMVSALQKKEIAAVASKEAAKEYNLAVLEENIENFSNNQTRFAIIGKTLAVAADATKTSILLMINHQSGSLAQIVSQFQYEEVNMVKITSRPLANVRWQYQFFIEFEGCLYDDNIQRLLQRLEKETLFLRVLGSYKIYE